MISKIEALRAMKSRRGEDTIILFHNRAFFEAYEQDAAVVAKVGLTSEVVEGISTVRIPESEQESITDKLLDAGCAVCISEMRDSEGNFVVNINQEEANEEES